MGGSFFSMWDSKLEPTADDNDLEHFFHTLYKLAELGARGRTIRISTKFLAEKLGLSQQTVSRRLIELGRKGLIERRATRDGSMVRISDKGEAQLRKVRLGLSMIFEQEHPPSVTIEGTVFSGLGEGAYYVSREPYRKQFIEKLGFDPYPGTLNLRISSEYDAKMREELETYPGIVIEGYEDENRTYGSGKCFHALINNREKGALVFALRTHYDRSVIEVIAPCYLRRRLKLKDGNKVKVEVFTKEL